MALIISREVLQKIISKHAIKYDDVIQCFANRERKFLEDSREEHKTNPATRWFIAENDYGRKIKVVFVPSGSDYHIKTAYAANPDEVRIYEKYAPII